MKFRRCLEVIFLLQSIKICMAYKTKYREEIVQEVSFMPEESYIFCACNGKSIRMDIPKKDRLNVYEQLRQFSYCELNSEKEICVLYRDCHTCKFHMTRCWPNAHKKYDCHQRSFETFQKRSVHVINDFPNSLRLHKRDLSFCSLPSQSDTYDLICRKYQSYMKCVQTCIHGYTLKRGISARKRCLFKEKKWKPTGFNECRPYLECGMTLIHPGILECISATTTDFPSCNVTCDPFEGKSGTPLETFECGITGTWNKQPPFCVIPKAGLVGNLLTGSELVPPPKHYRYPSEEDLLQFPEDDGF